jgi:hypothetical protein
LYGLSTPGNILQLELGAGLEEVGNITARGFAKKNGNLKNCGITPRSPNSIIYELSLPDNILVELVVTIKKIINDILQRTILNMSYFPSLPNKGWLLSFARKENEGTTRKCPKNRYKSPTFDVSIPKKNISPIIKIGRLIKASPKVLCKASI